MVLPLVTMLLPVAFGALDAFVAYWGARDDPTWETRWRSLDPAERTWLAVVATSRPWIASLTDPEEIRLAKGARRRELRRRVDFDLASLPFFVAAAALVLAGVVGANAVLVTVFAFGGVRLVWTHRRERRIKGELETQRQLAAGTAA